MIRRLFASLLVAILFLLCFDTGILADNSQDVTVTGSPFYIGISIDISTWTLNGITGSGTIFTDTTYYANPLDDTTPPSATVQSGECRFTVSNTAGAETCDLTVNCGNFVGGGAAMANSNDGSNGPALYGGYSWYEGMTYTNKIIMKTSGSDELYSLGLAGGNSIKIGAEILTRTNIWGSSSPSTATMTVVATAH